MSEEAAVGRRLTRLLKMILRLQGRSRWTRKALAEEYSVSQRMIDKDLVILRQIGYVLDHTREGYSVRGSPRALRIVAQDETRRDAREAMRRRYWENPEKSREQKADYARQRRKEPAFRERQNRATFESYHRRKEDPEFRERQRQRNRERYAADPEFREKQRQKAAAWYRQNRERKLAQDKARHQREREQERDS